MAQADQFYPEVIQPETYAVSSEFRLIDEVVNWELGDGQFKLLRAALSVGREPKQ